MGEPDFLTPWHIREAGIESLQRGKTYYTSNDGIAELRAEICNYQNRRFGLSYNPKNEVIVTVGGSEAIDIGVRALVNPGDEVIIPIPAFVCYGPIVEMAHGIPVYIQTKAEDSFKITPEALRAAITPKTKLLILPFPNNPTGAVLTRAELEEIAEILRGTDIMILSDEIYAELTYGFKHTPIATLDGMWERTITVIETMAAEYNRRRKYILNGLSKIGIDCFEAKGAFYVFPDIRKFGLTSDEFCKRLLDEKGVAIVPGNAFGLCGEGFARISYAYSADHITKALEAMGEFVKTL